MLTVIVLTFIAVFMVSYALFLWFTAARGSASFELRKRLRLMERDETWHNIPDDLRKEIVKETPPFERLISKIPLLRSTEKWLEHSGLNMSPTQFILLVMALALLAFALVFLLRRDYILSVVAAVLVLSASYVILLGLKRQRTEKFTEQLPDALTMIARSLRAGHAFSASLALVGNELPEPAGGLFKTAFEQQKLGLPVTNTLINMTERVESLDLRFFVMVISINADVGGNLAEILDKLAETIRERLKIKRQVKVYTAQGRLSGYLLAILPIIAFVALNFLLPGYEDVFLKEEKGRYILLIAVVWQLIGFLFIRKIINIRI